MNELTIERYNQIKLKYGNMSSWAIYADKKENDKEKSGVGDITIFQTLNLNKLNPNIVFVGLNISEKITTVFGNFHSDSPSAQDYKIRHAIKGTIFEGGYMTDIIKDFEQKVSGELMKYLSKNKDFEKDNIQKFEEELNDIGSINPIIIAFGTACFNILQRNLKNKYRIYKVTHYSAFITKEKLRLEIEELSNVLN